MLDQAAAIGLRSRFGLRLAAIVLACSGISGCAGVRDMPRLAAGFPAKAVTIRYAAVSPDGQKIALEVVAPDGPASLWVVGGGQHPVRLTDWTSFPITPSWDGASARVVFTRYSARGNAVAVIDVASEALRDIVGPSQKEIYLYPRFHPDGTRVAFIAEQAPALPRIGIATVARSGSPRMVAGDDISLGSLSWSMQGGVLYYCSARQRQLKSLDTPSSSTRVLTVVPAGPGAFFGTYPSPDGRWLLCTARATGSGGYGAWLLDLRRRSLARLPVELHSVKAAWSPDGSHIAVSQAAPVRGADLAIIDIPSGAVRSVTHGATDEPADGCAWTPDGRIVFRRQQPVGIMSVRSDGSNGRVLIRDVDLGGRPRTSGIRLLR